jgi:hypothetical protein
VIVMKRISRGGASALNAAIAAFAACSVAFAIFAMPTDLFASLIDGAGLPLILSAAQPPLGSTARLAVMAAGAALSFISVWLLLNGLDGMGRRRTEIVPEPEWLAPRVRRADAHPDAPLRRPIFAGSDLGEPSEDNLVADSNWLDMAATVPGHRAEETDMPAPSAADQADAAADEPSEADEIERIAPPAAAADEHPDEAMLELRQDQMADEAEDQDISTEALMARLPLPDGRGESVSNLIERLDAGLAACEWPLAAASPGTTPEPADNRLQAALDELQRMAGRR